MPGATSFNDARPEAENSPPGRLYLVTPPWIAPDFASLLNDALAAAPVACVRLDLGMAEEADWRRAADLLMPTCHEADVALVIADHWRLVSALGLDGVHLADARVQLRDVREELGPGSTSAARAGASR